MALNETSPGEKAGWVDDLLDRKKYADFLTNYVEGKCLHDSPALVLALDAPWGSGKTFFIDNWSTDLKSLKRVVVKFNAWENDSAEDPVVSFMAELRNGLVPFREALPVGDAVREAIETKSREVVSNLRRAVLPVLGVVAKAVVKKATGIATEELMDAVAGVDDEPSSDAGDLRESSIEAMDKGLDKFFEKALEGHSDRLNSIKLFRKSLEELLSLLNEKAEIKGPLYVFVDELDRCRPDYAIRLLEGIKHLFSVKGVAFVVATNLSQLSKAVGGIYGVNFDGYLYLKRFFDIECSLPTPTRQAFIASRLKGSVLEGAEGCTGMDPHLEIPEDKSPSAAISHVANALQLDLRSIQAIISVSEAAVLGLPKGKKIASMWLFFVAAMRHLHPEVFKIITLERHGLADFRSACLPLLSETITVPAVNLETGRVGAFPLINVITFFFDISKEVVNNETFDARRLRELKGQYPDTLFSQLSLFEGNWRRGHPHSISEYPSLLALAGHVSA